MAENIVSPKQVKRLFDFGLSLEEPNVWDIFPDIQLRIYDRVSSYFACWDIGPAIEWLDPFRFDCQFYHVDGISMMVVKHG